MASSKQYIEAKDIKEKEWKKIKKGLEGSNYFYVIAALKESDNTPIPADVLFGDGVSVDGAHSSIQTMLRKNNIPFTLARVGKYKPKTNRFKRPLAFVRVERK